MLECGHTYHAQCLIDCKEKGHLNCPDCRQPFNADISLLNENIWIKQTADVYESEDIPQTSTCCIYRNLIYSLNGKIR